MAATVEAGGALQMEMPSAGAPPLSNKAFKLFYHSECRLTRILSGI